MCGIDEGLEVGIRAEMRIDAGEVDYPMDVVARARQTRAALHRLVLEDRADPQGRRVSCSWGTGCGVPKGIIDVVAGKQVTTGYPGGVPGDHLQVAQTVYRGELLNKWGRMMCWVSGHGEGWALYAERLMAELGHLEDPGNPDYDLAKHKE